MDRDPNIWQELAPMPDGFTPAVPRRWMFVGTRFGETCRFPVELEKRHPSLEGVYSASAIFAHNVHYCCNDWVNVRDLEPTEFYNA